MTVDPDSIPGLMARTDPFSGPAVAVALPAPTNSDDEWAEWQVGDVTVGTGTPVCLYIDDAGGFSREITVLDPVALAGAILAAHRGEWPAPTGKDVTA